MKKSFSVLLILRKDKKGVDGKCPIYVQVTLNCKVMKLPTKKKVFENNWDSSSRLCIGKGFGEMNVFLKEIVVNLERFCQNVINNKELLTLDKIRDYYNDVSINCFYTVYDKVFKIKAKGLKPATIYKYNVLRRYLKEFRKRIDISEIDINFVEKFEDFLLLKDGGIAGINNHHKNLKAIINLAMKHKLMKENPYLNKKLKYESEKFDFLTPEELEQFSKIKIEDNAGLKLTKDRFLFGCYTSLRHSDVNNLKVGDVDKKSKVIRIKQIKTENYVEVPLNTRARILYEQYKKGKEDDELLFTAVANQNDNERLKVLADKIELKFNLTFHVSRHTFGTLMINYFNVPITIVSRIMGHCDIKMTQRYATVDIGMMKNAMKKFKF